VILRLALRLQASKAVSVLNNLHERKFEKRLILKLEQVATVEQIYEMLKF